MANERGRRGVYECRTAGTSAGAACSRFGRKGFELIRAGTIIRARNLVCTSAVALLGGCGGGVLDPKGPVGGDERTILLNALVIMLAIVVPTIVAALAIAWWFRASNTRATYLPTWAYSGRIEVIVWAIPTLVITFLGALIWIGSHRLDPYRPLDSKMKPVEVQVVSLDWKWLFIYPGQGVASVNQLVVPAGVPVHFSLTSGSVMNAFFVPQLGGMIYTMNGMVTQLSLQADAPGVFHGQSSHFSGDGFSGMKFDVRAVPAAAFAGWVAAAKADGPVLDVAAYRAFASQSQDVKPFTWRAVEPALFTAISSQRIPASAGPTTGRGGARVNPESEK